MRVSAGRGILSIMTELPIFLDIEASSLNSGSYPIEVAWSDADGDIESHLINPYHVDRWVDWDLHAQALHGLSREYLMKHGEAPWAVARRVMEVLRYREIYSTAPEFDQFWLDELFRAAGVKNEEVKLFDFFHLWEGRYPAAIVYPLLHDLDEAAWARVPSECGKQHRAGADVRQMIELYRLVNEILE